jgi:4-amino-4-deoxy-L-arabinose transferase-like glycosyltransferase
MLNRPALVLGAAALLLHLSVNGGYGIFRDELYYIVCGQHLAWGYMDQPPLTPAIAALSWAVFGGWLPGFRLAPALCFAATVILTIQLARLLSAGRFATWLAGITVFAGGVLQVFGVLLTTDILQPPAWTACTYLLVRAVRDGEKRAWLALGATAGIAFLGKYNVAFHLGALGLAILLLPQRRALLAWQPFAAAAIMLAIAAPNLLWQALHGWPFLAHIRDLAANHTISLGPLAYMAQQILQAGPGTLLVWAAGLAALLFWPGFRNVRWIGLGYVLLIAFGFVTSGKPYYVAPVYPGLFAAGAVALEAWLASTALRTGLAALVTAGAIQIAPLVLPILPPARLVAYMTFLGLVPSTGERTQDGALPQYFADMFGWQAYADSITAAWRALPEADRAQAAFLGRNYGETAAVQLLGHGPDAISLHQSYWFWGPKGHDGSVLLHMGESRAHLLTLFDSVEQVGTTPTGWGMPYESGRPIWLCRGMHPKLPDFWKDHLQDN